MRNVQRAHARPDPEVLARVHDRAHAVVVERLLQADRGFDPAYAGHVAGIGVFHHEEVTGFVRLGLVFHRAAGALNARRQGIAIRLESGETGTGLLREPHERVHIASLHNANDDHCASPVNSS